MRGALEDTIGRISTACSREQIGQFWINRLWRQNVGTSISGYPSCAPACRSPCRSRYARALARLPHPSMLHHAPEWFLVWS